MILHFYTVAHPVCMSMIAPGACPEFATFALLLQRSVFGILRPAFPNINDIFR